MPTYFNPSPPTFATRQLMRMKEDENMEFLNHDIVSDFAVFKTKINNEVNQM